MGNLQGDTPNSQPALNNNQQEVRPEGEINLKSYFDVILKRKKFILYLFLICIVITSFVTLLLPKVYSASASIMVTPSRVRSVLSPVQSSLDPEKTTQGGYVEQKPTISIPTHKALLKSNTVLERVMNKLKTEGKLDKDLTLEELSKKLDVEGTKETNVLQLAVKDNYPYRAKDIVNTWAREYALYSMELITGEVKGSGEFVFDQFDLSRENLVKAEQAAREFDVKERLSLMEIELKENQSQLDAHYAKVCNLEFTLKEKKSRLQKTKEDIAAMTKNGFWLGTFDVRAIDDISFIDQGLNDSQKALRQEALKAKLEFEESRKKRDSFVNDSRIYILKDEVTAKKQELLNDKSLLSKVKQLGESTKVNLKSKGNLNKLENFKGPIAENLSDLTMWEILSLAEGYNFFETQGKFLEMKLQQEQTELKALEKTLTEYEEKLKTLNETFERAQANYNFYLEMLKALENGRNSLQMEIANTEFELSYSRDLAKKLEDQVMTLKIAINEKKVRFTELNRQLQICQETYNHLSSKIEEARIAKAMELGEVKVVSLAFEPKYPVWPRKRQILAVAGVTSLILGVFAAFFLESRDKEKDINNISRSSS